MLELGPKLVVPFWRVVGLVDSGALWDEVGLEVLQPSLLPGYSFLTTNTV